MSQLPVIAPAHVPIFAVVGNPVEHSLSPSIHEQFSKQTGYPVHYTTVLAPFNGFADSLRKWVNTTQAKGCNVTVPFKFEAYAMAATCTPRAHLAQAVNTLVFPSDDAATWKGDNTDGIGLVNDITMNAKIPLHDQRVLLLGAGGASSGVLGPIIEQAPAKVVVANRNMEKAQALVQRHHSLAQKHGVSLSAISLSLLEAPESFASYQTPFDIIINGTAASLGGKNVPLSASALRPGCLVIDLMYGKAAQPFLQWAQQHGAVTRDGLGMLVEQAAQAFYLWNGIHPETASVISAMRLNG